MRKYYKQDGKLMVRNGEISNQTIILDMLFLSLKC